MKTLTVKLAEALDAKLATAAQIRGESKSSLVREAIASYVGTEVLTTSGLSCYDLSRDLAGSFEGPVDLSRNKAHLKGYGR